MSPEALRLYEAALQLSVADRRLLGVLLLDGVGDGSTPEEVEASWRVEIRRRMAEVLEGRVQGIPHEEVMREVREMIERAKRARTG